MLRRAIAIDFAGTKTIFILPNDLGKEYKKLDGEEHLILPFISLLALQDYLTPDFRDKSMLRQYGRAVEHLEAVLLEADSVVLSCNHGRTRSIIIALAAVARFQGEQFDFDNELLLVSALYKYREKQEIFFAFKPDSIRLWRDFICGAR